MSPNNSFSAPWTEKSIKDLIDRIDGVSGTRGRGSYMLPNNPFSAPLEDPQVQEHFKNYGVGAYSSNPELKKFGSTLGNFVSKQPISFTDETGTVNIDPANQGFSVQPRQGFGLAVKGRDMRFGTPSAEVTFQFGGSEQTPSSVSNVQDSRPARSAGREFVDRYIDANKLREAARYYY